MPWRPKFPEVYGACLAKCPPYPTADPLEGDEAKQAQTLAEWRAHAYCANKCREIDMGITKGGKKSKKNNGKKNRSTRRSRRY